MTCLLRFQLTTSNFTNEWILILILLSNGAWGFPGGSMVKNLPANAGDSGSIPGLGRSPGEGNGNPLQYSCLGNPMDRGVWQATVCGVTKSQTQLRDWTTVNKWSSSISSLVLHRTISFCVIQEKERDTAVRGSPEGLWIFRGYLGFFFLSYKESVI